jgi:hypothetical protein
MAFNINGTTGLTFNNGSTQNVGGIGIAQTWQNVSASRAINTTYTNSTGKPIMVSVATPTNNANNLLIDGIVVATAVYASVTPNTVSGIVPNGSTYSISGSFGSWCELR